MNIFNRNNIIFGFVILLTIVFTGAAGVQFVKSLIPTQTLQTSQTDEQNSESAAPSSATTTDTSTTNTEAESNTDPVQDTTTSNTTATDTTNKTDTQIDTTTTTTNSNSTKAFTATELSTHDTTSSCYVAFDGKVYDVTNDRTWRGCYHHGVRGGVDITSIFPHPLYYLDTLTIVGDYSG